MDARRLEYLTALGVSAWELRQPPGYLAEAPPLQGAPDGVLEQLRQRVAACTRCALHASRTQTVFGVGSATAQLLIIGEAPGAEEDRLGEPFVGRAGQLLNAMLASIGLDRHAVYIANILKCRPPRNRDPKPEEAEACAEFLAGQIRAIQPRLILAVGRIAAQWLLRSDAPLGRLRGRLHHYGADQTPLLVTYHPAYLLRSPAQKRRAWEDLCRVRQLLDDNTS